MGFDGLDGLGSGVVWVLAGLGVWVLAGLGVCVLTGLAVLFYGFWRAWQWCGVGLGGLGSAVLCCAGFGGLCCAGPDGLGLGFITQ